MREIDMEEKFDAILVRDGIYFLLCYDDILKVFSNFSRSLEEGGVLIFNVPIFRSGEQPDHEITTFQGKNAYRLEIRIIKEFDDVKSIFHEEWVSLVDDRGKVCMIRGEAKFKLLSYEEVNMLLQNSGFEKEKIHCFHSYEAKEEVKDDPEELIFVVVK